MKKLITVALGLLMLSACAFTEDSIPVHYTAPANLELVQGASDVTLEVVGQDGRVANRDRISSKKNGYGMETARILAAQRARRSVAATPRAPRAARHGGTGQGSLSYSLHTPTRLKTASRAPHFETRQSRGRRAIFLPGGRTGVGQREVRLAGPMKRPCVTRCYARPFVYWGTGT